MARKRIQLPTAYEKSIKLICLIEECSTKDAKNIYKRKVGLKLLPE